MAMTVTKEDIFRFKYIRGHFENVSVYVHGQGETHGRDKKAREIQKPRVINFFLYDPSTNCFTLML